MRSTLVVILSWIVCDVYGICEPIRIEMCRGLGYNVTAMPNLVGHEIQGDADFTLQTFSPLIQYGCSAQLHLFLCSVYAPMCTDKVSSPIGPCRGLCEQVRARCFPVLQGFGFPWPAALNCSRFPPENNHRHMCMEGPGEPGPINPVLVVNSKNAAWGCSWYAKSALYIFLNRSGKCAAACDADILWSQKDKKLTEAWMAAFTTISLISVVIAILSLLRSRKRDNVLNTAEKFIALLTICHAAIAAGYVIRLVAGRIAVACTSAVSLPPQEQVMMLESQQRYLTQDGLANPYCATVFFLLYYFGNAASVWWVIVCAWWCIVVKKWTRTCGDPKKNFGLYTEFSTIGTIAAWGVPAAFTIAVLVTRDVDADELTGTCFVGQQSTRSLLFLVLIPQILYQFLGTVFLLFGMFFFLLPRSIAIPTRVFNTVPSSATLRHRGNLKSPLEIQRYRRTEIKRIGIFAWLHYILTASLTGSIFYEWLCRESWLRAPEPSTIPRAPQKPILQFFILKIVVTLGAGILSSSWIWWPKIIGVWRRLPPCKQPPYKCHPPLSVVHCYGSGSTSHISHQVHPLGHLAPVQHPLLQEEIEHTMARSYSKKHKKYRKHHSGSETQV
ncbi:frizzled-4-like [Calliopsis andreniformis]|uniref:frizzled-4-like n=1 Tax=Calliopsis andreniformis TaxID=337506 RepID=UPI003FCD1F1C